MFQTLKGKLITPPVLKYPDFHQSFILTTDASGEGLGAVLSQGKVGKDLPVAFASRTLNRAERVVTLHTVRVVILHTVRVVTLHTVRVVILCFKEK